MGRYFLPSVAVSFCFGILIATYVHSLFILILVAGVGILLVLAQFLIRNTHRELVFFVGLLLLALALGMIRFLMTNTQAPKDVEALIGEVVSFQGEIVDEPDIRETNQKILIATKELAPEKIRILATLESYLDVSYGDAVEVKGLLTSPKNFQTDQGKEFDYISYLAKNDIFLLLPKAEVTVLASRQNAFFNILYRFKHSFTENISRVIPEPESTFLTGIVLGAKSALPQSLRNAFIATGTIHIVALSGYNVTVVAKAIENIGTTFLAQGAALSFGAVAIVLFVLATGAQSTTIRSGIMALLVILARRTGRTYDIERALAIALLVMLLWNPRLLVFDVSFQLSFLATLGIIYLTPIIEKKFIWIKILWLRDIVATTFAAQIAVLPFILYKMGTLSLISFPINMVILPFIPVAMFLGFIVGLLGYLGPIISLPLGYVTYTLLHAILWLIQKASTFPFAMVTVSHFPLIIVFILYGVLIGIVYRTKKRIVDYTK